MTGMTVRSLVAGIGAAAAVVVAMVTPAQASADLLFGQRHNYTVTMRGNGEAVVTARLVFTNTTDKPETVFAFSSSQPLHDLVGYQQSITTACVSYGNSNVVQTQPDVGKASGTAAPNSFVRPCLSYAEPDFLAYNPPNSSYDKVTFTDQGSGSYQVKLAHPVAVQASGALLVGYTTAAAKNVWGRYEFTFQTLKVPERVKDAYVAVDVDSDLYLLGGKAKVTYATPKATASDLSGAPASQLDTLAYGLGQNGELTKEAHDLAAQDSFSVKGTYADAVWKLHPGLVFMVLVVALGLVGGLGWWWRRRQAVAKLKPVVAPAPAPVLVFADPALIAASLATTVAVGLLTWAILAYADQAASADGFISAILGVLAVIAYAVVVVGPVAWLAVRRRDWRVAVYVLVWDVVCLVVLLLIYTLAIRPLFLNPDGQPGTNVPM